ncbi:MAG: hypothetical protein ACFE8N_05355 [Promethearchaeota archaeon]
MDYSKCVCPICTHQDKNMVYVPNHKIWYCTECQVKDLFGIHLMAVKKIEDSTII